MTSDYFRLRIGDDGIKIECPTCGWERTLSEPMLVWSARQTAQEHVLEDHQ